MKNSPEGAQAEDIVVRDDNGNIKGVKPGQIVYYDAISYSGILDANFESFSKRAIPTYHFNKAKTIVSVGADFMGNWLDSLMYVNDYAQTRKPSGKWMSKHFQFEANMSMTGTNEPIEPPSTALSPDESTDVVDSRGNDKRLKRRNVPKRKRTGSVEDLIEQTAASRRGNISVPLGREDTTDLIFPEFEQIGIDEKKIRASPFGKILFGVLDKLFPVFKEPNWFDFMTDRSLLTRT